MAGFSCCSRKTLDFQINADDFRSTLSCVMPRALAQLSEAPVCALTQFQSGTDQHAIHLNAVATLEFKQHTDQSAIRRATTEHPAAAAEDGSRQRLDHVAGFIERKRLQLDRPGYGERFLDEAG